MNLLYEILISAGHIARAIATSKLGDALLCVVGFLAFAAAIGMFLSLV